MLREHVEMQSLLQHWERNARGHEDFNWAFLCSLSNRLEKAVDRTARRLHREAFAIIDCTRCAHCCKTMKVTTDAHLVSEQDHERLVRALKKANKANPRLRRLKRQEMDRYVCSQIVELTWLIGHFCLLNRWFTALQVPDEGPDDEANFLAVYEEVVPADIRERNEKVLAGGF